MDNVTVVVKWNSSQIIQIEFFVTVTPPLGNGQPSTISTNKRSYQFTIPYHTTYTINVVGRNCAGNSNQLNKTFTFGTYTQCHRHLHTYNTTIISCSNLLIIRIKILHVGKCEPPETGENMTQSNREAVSFLEDSQILISCSLGYSMLKGNDTIVTCTCLLSETSCNWLPDPTQLQCLSTWSESCFVII